MATNTPDNESSILIGPGAAIVDPHKVSGFYSVDNLKALVPDDLKDPHVYEKVALFVRTIDDGSEIFRAKECFQILHALLDLNANFDSFDSELLRGYFHLLVILKANFLSLLSEKEIQIFLREQSLTAISAQLFGFPGMYFAFDLQDKFYVYFKWDTWYLPEADKKEILRLFVDSLEHNEEFLGEKPLVIDGKLLDQTMANWILDYNRSAHIKSGKRVSLEKAKYLSNGPLVNQLDLQQKKILEKFLSFYDWLKFEAIELTASPYLDKLNALLESEGKKTKLSKESLGFRNYSRGSQVSSSPIKRVTEDIRDVRMPSPKFVPPQPIPRPVPKPAPKPVSKPAAPPPRPPQDLPIQMPKTLGASPDGVNVQKRLYKTDVLDDKAGLVYGGVPQVQKPPAPAKKPDLDSKLEELKNKMKQNDSRIEEKLKALKKKIGDK